MKKFMRTIQILFKFQRKTLRGSALIFTLVMTAVSAIIFSGLIGYVVSHIQYGMHIASREESLQIAEAGVSFYRWYIAHELENKDPEDVTEFWESTSPAPLGVSTAYEADFSGLGKYRITVTPPEENSTLFSIQSTGWTYKRPSITRTIEVRFRRPAWSEYIILVDEPFSLNSSTEVFGQMHSNQGVRFDGVAHSIVSASVPCYNDPDTVGGGDCEQPGIWTGSWPVTEYNTTLGNLVFMGGKSFPISEISFSSVMADLDYMEDESQNNGTAAHHYGPSGQQGYYVEFKPTQYEITEIKTINATTKEITKLDNSTKETHDYPSKGLVFVQDSVWFDGKGTTGVKVDSARMTLVAADLTGGTDPNIYIADGANYKNGGGGQECLGFVAEGSIDFPKDSKNNITIHGALLAQKGSVRRSDYGDSKNSITIFGSVASKQRIEFTGYQSRSFQYDDNLIIDAPPYFPTGKRYLIDRWEEL